MTIKCLGCGHYVTMVVGMGPGGKFGRCECSNGTDLVEMNRREACKAKNFDLVLCWDSPTQEFVPVEKLLYVNKIR